MAGLGRRKGKAPVVTPEGLDRGKVGIRNRKLRAVCAFSNTQTVRFRYRDVSANWPRRGAPRSGGYLRGGRSASYGLLRPRGRASDIRRTGDYGISRRPRSFRLDARELHHPAPLLSIIRNKFAELGRRAWKHRGA